MIHLLLWVGQIILAIKLLTVTLTHGVRPEAAKLERGTARFGGLNRPLLLVIALVALLTALALVLPPLVGMPGRVVVWAAGFAAAFMLVGMALHIRCREHPKAWVGVILALIAAAVAYGRAVLAPF